MEPRQIVVRRMHNQRLWGKPFDTPEEVVRWLGAVQAQEFPVAKWSVAQRSRGVDDAAMNRAFADGAILRTHILRPTWHFVLPEDLRWMMALSAPRVNAVNATYYRQLELDDRLFARSQALFTEALAGGAQLTRKELAARLERVGITAAGLRLGYIMMRAELDAVVCSGAPRGKQHTYALFDERVPRAPARLRDEAVAELMTRYFTSRGPATVRDYARWSGLTVADCSVGLDSITSQLEHETVDGRTYWWAPTSGSAKTPSTVIDLVQGYDECIMSYSESKDVLFEPSPSTRDTPEQTTVLTHAVLRNGRLLGHWRHAPKQRSVVLETALYRALNRTEARALDVAVGRYGQFLGRSVTMREPPAPAR